MLENASWRRCMPFKLRANSAASFKALSLAYILCRFAASAITEPKEPLYALFQINYTLIIDLVGNHQRGF